VRSDARKRLDAQPHWDPSVVALIERARAEALEDAADWLALDSSLTDCTKRPTEYADARDDERVDVVGLLRDRAAALRAAERAEGAGA
jgi:hypothetical protein